MDIILFTELVTSLTCFKCQAKALPVSYILLDGNCVLFLPNYCIRLNQHIALIINFSVNFNHDICIF